MIMCQGSFPPGCCQEGSTSLNIRYPVSESFNPHLIERTSVPGIVIAWICRRSKLRNWFPGCKCCCFPGLPSLITTCHTWGASISQKNSQTFAVFGCKKHQPASFVPFSLSRPSLWVEFRRWNVPFSPNGQIHTSKTHGAGPSIF